MKRDISVVICAYTEDRWDDLIATVESVRKQSAPAGEIIVVIDHNLRLLRRVCAQVSGVIAVENRQQRGLSGARNTGIETAKGEVIAFLDDDAVAATDWLERLSVGYTDESTLGVGGSIEPAWPDSRPGWFPEEFDWVVGCTYRGMPSIVAPVRNLIGCNMSFRRDVFEAIGWFRDEIGRVGTRPVGCEETELCIRALQRWRDKKLLYEPRAKVFHRVSDKRAQWKYFCSRCYSEGLSKALISRYVGSHDATASERNYTFRILPHSFLRGIADTFRRFDVSGLTRSGTIAVGLFLTTFGFLVGTASEQFKQQEHSAMSIAIRE